MINRGKKRSAAPKTTARGEGRGAERPKKATAKGRTRRTVSGRPRPTTSRDKPAKGRSARRVKVRRVELPDPSTVGVGLSEEDAIRSAKFLPRELPPRRFEEERFLFPESYGVDRVRLLVRDPDWIFAYWDVSPGSLKRLGRSIGQRALELSRLTLRVVDPVSGGSSDILLPPGARWWYIRTDSARRSYRAELGITLPSGDFHRLAGSNTVVAPRVGPSAEPARRRIRYRDAREITPAAAEAAARAEGRRDTAAEPWRASSFDGAAPPATASPRGGASDAFRPGGASDAFRPRGSETGKR